MSSKTTNVTDGSGKFLRKDYELHIRLGPDPACKQESGWLVLLEFMCHSLLHTMNEGLFWTTANIVPEGGFIRRTPPGANEAGHSSYQRVYELREFPDKPTSESRWTATATVHGYSVQAVSDFHLTALSRRHLQSSWAINKNQNWVFIYNSLPRAQNFNAIVDTLHPMYGSWWFWPMEKITDGETKSTVESQTETDTEKHEA